MCLYSGTNPIDSPGRLNDILLTRWMYGYARNNMDQAPITLTNAAAAAEAAMALLTMDVQQKAEAAAFVWL